MRLPDGKILEYWLCMSLMVMLLALEHIGGGDDVGVRLAGRRAASLRAIRIGDFGGADDARDIQIALGGSGGAVLNSSSSLRRRCTLCLMHSTL